jgi:hypothetical protein
MGSNASTIQIIRASDIQTEVTASEILSRQSKSVMMVTTWTAMGAAKNEKLSYPIFALQMEAESMSEQPFIRGRL